MWDRAARTATCAECVAKPKPLERGTAGASSLRRYEGLHNAREARAKERFGRFSGVYLRVTNEPQSTRAWAIGGRGEERLGKFLETLHDGKTVIVLHDRRIPRSRANIDHLAVTANGVFVIDAKNYAGKVRKIDRAAGSRATCASTSAAATARGSSPGWPSRWRRFGKPSAKRRSPSSSWR
jgi:hypothetical protein